MDLAKPLERNLPEHEAVIAVTTGPVGAAAGQSIAARENNGASTPSPAGVSPAGAVVCEELVVTGAQLTAAQEAVASYGGVSVSYEPSMLSRDTGVLSSPARGAAAGRNLSSEAQAPM